MKEKNLLFNRTVQVAKDKIFIVPIGWDQSFDTPTRKLKKKLEDNKQAASGNLTKAELEA
jgi:hypothetical protein